MLYEVITDIKSSEWLREVYEESERSDDSYEYEDDDEGEYEGGGYENSKYEDYEIKITDKFDVIIPSVINTFSYYFIYSNDGELLRYKSTDEEIVITSYSIHYTKLYEIYIP